jgi:hypothetical protein
MQVSPRPELDQRYQNLTPRQQAVVDARTQNPDATNRDIAHSIAPEIYNSEKRQQGDEEIDQMNESYTSQFQNKDGIKELIEYRQEIQDNQRNQGEMQTTGDPFSADPNMPKEKSGWQSVKERPEKGHPQQTQEPRETYQFQAPVQVEIKDDRYSVDFEKEYFMHLLSSKRLPPELHEELVESVLEEKSV